MGPSPQADHPLHRRGAQLPQPHPSFSLDRRQSLQQGLEVAGVAHGTGLQHRLQGWIILGEALAGAEQRPQGQAGGLAGVDLAAEGGDLGVVKESAEDSSTRIRGSPHQPAAAYPVTAETRSLQGFRHELLEHQGGAQHGDAIAGQGIGRQHGRVGIGAAGHHLAAGRKVEQGGGFGPQGPQHPAAGADLRQAGGPALAGDGAAPSLLLQVPAETQVVALLPPSPASQEPAHQPVGLMTQPQGPIDPCGPSPLQQLQGAGQAAAGTGRRTLVVHQGRCCSLLAGAGVVIRESAGQCCPGQGAIRPAKQQGA